MTTRPPRERKVAQRLDSVAVGNITNEELRRCVRYLRDLREQKLARPFSQPVDPVALGIPDYHTIIHRPMDLSTVLDKLVQGLYSTLEDVERDIEQIWQNCRTYNGEDHPLAADARELAQAVNQRLQRIRDQCSPDRILARRREQMKQQLRLKIGLIRQEIDQLRQGSTQKRLQQEARKLHEPLDPREKRRLNRSIQHLSVAEIEQVWGMIQAGCPSAVSVEADTKKLRMDLDALDVQTAREVERFVLPRAQARRQAVSAAVLANRKFVQRKKQEANGEAGEGEKKKRVRRSTGSENKQPKRPRKQPVQLPPENAEGAVGGVVPLTEEELEEELRQTAAQGGTAEREDDDDDEEEEDEDEEDEEGEDLLSANGLISFTPTGALPAATAAAAGNGAGLLEDDDEDDDYDDDAPL